VELGILSLSDLQTSLDTGQPISAAQRIADTIDYAVTVLSVLDPVRVYQDFAQLDLVSNELKGGAAQLPDRHYLWQGRAPRDPRRCPAVPARARLDRRHQQPRTARRLDRPTRRDRRPHFDSKHRVELHLATVAGLRRDYPEIGWHRLAEWAVRQDWSLLA